MVDESSILPFHTYLWKIANRCNLNCDYCYVFNSLDDAWKRFPPFMSIRTAETTVARMRQHLLPHREEDVSIIFHGGEPLLGGLSHLQSLVRVIHSGFSGTNINASLGMQSNLLLFDDEIGRFLIDSGISIGVSVDGPPQANDHHRIDHAGRPTSARLEQRLSLMKSRYPEAFSGFLCVVDLNTDPIEVVDYLASWQPPSIDFLLPLDNHDRRPRGKEGERGLDATPYGDWLVQAFGRWCQLPDPPAVRMFHSIIRLLGGGDTLVESLGLLPVDLIVVESDGSIEAVDSLRTTYKGATHLGYNVFDHSFDEAARDVRVRARQLGASSLSAACQRCSLVKVCGGGYLPHRWSAEHGFLNPSVYCSDLQVVIRHIMSSLSAELLKVRASN
jgi:radical SAM/SPASM domain FxsB family protein